MNACGHATVDSWRLWIFFITMKIKNNMIWSSLRQIVNPIHNLQKKIYASKFSQDMEVLLQWLLRCVLNLVNQLDMKLLTCLDVFTISKVLSKNFISIYAKLSGSIAKLFVALYYRQLLQIIKWNIKRLIC